MRCTGIFFPCTRTWENRPAGSGFPCPTSTRIPALGSAERLNRGRTIIFAVVIGLLIIYGAWLFINLFLTTIGVASWTGLGNWWEIECTIPYAHWRLNERSGNIASESMRGYDGTLSASMTDANWVPGKIGNALQFNGTDEGVVADVPGISPSNMAFEFWVKQTETRGNFMHPFDVFSDASTVHRATVYVNQNTYEYWYKFFIDGANLCSPGNPQKCEGPIAKLDDHQWHHIKVSFDGRFLKAFVDGEQKVNKDTGGGKIDKPQDKVWIGRSSATHNYFAGFIDDVKIYSFGD